MLKNYIYVYIYATIACLISYYIKTLRPRQNGRHFTDDTFNPIFLNENIRISIKISLKFVPKVPINNIPASVQIMAWRRPGDKPLSELMMVYVLTHMCVTRPQWVKYDLIIMHHSSDLTLSPAFQQMAVQHSFENCPAISRKASWSFRSLYSYRPLYQDDGDHAQKTSRMFKRMKTKTDMYLP